MTTETSYTVLHANRVRISVILVIAALIAGTAYNAQPAYATTKLHLDSEIYLDRIEQFKPIFKSSSCKQVVVENVDGDSVYIDEENESVVAQSFGKAIITISWKECSGETSTVETWGENTYLTLGFSPYNGRLFAYNRDNQLVIANEEEYDIDEKHRFYTADGHELTWHKDAIYCKQHHHFIVPFTMTKKHKSATVNVSYARLEKTESDNLFTGRAYSFSRLCNFPSLKGRFVGGSGYKVSKRGTRVVFTSPKKTTVNYRLSGKTYKIKYIYPHSIEKLRSQTIRAIKKKALIPSSFQLISTKFNKSEGIMRVRFTVRNAYGVRVSQMAEGCYFSGKFDLSW